MLNILEDFAAEKNRIEETQRATLNILDDFNAEKALLEAIQKASVNILEDFDAEKGQLLSTQRASLNILDDFNAEKKRLEDVQSATLNILDDFEAEKARLEEMQSAVLNILDDFELEKSKVQLANRELTVEVNERKRVEEALLELNRELEAFTYSISHDLRAPLRHIDGFAQMLSEDFGPQLPEDAQRYLARICAGTRQMGELIDDFLNLARVGRQELRLQVTGLSSLVE
ncbi:MAG: sensor histidine kinase, partial [bacterium]